MRILALAISAIGIVVSMQPASAQTYDPAYPVCLHVYGRISYYECRYTSLPQCNASASGRPTSIAAAEARSMLDMVVPSLVVS